MRTSWVIGDGKNFVCTMAELAAKGVHPEVVDDQIGRLTFTEDLAGGFIHLLTHRPAYGTYSLTNEGESVSWAEVAAMIFEPTGHNPNAITPISTSQYFAGHQVAARPAHSTLELAKLACVGFTPWNAEQRLKQLLNQQPEPRATKRSRSRAQR